jgi:hypothetical protein
MAPVLSVVILYATAAQCAPVNCGDPLCLLYS